MKENILGIIIVLLFFLLLYLTLPSDEEVRENNRINFINLSFRGVVYDKFIDKSEHSFPIVIIKSIEDTIVYKINFARESNSMFDSLNTLDTVYKNRGENVIYSKRNNAYIKIGPAYFN